MNSSQKPARTSTDWPSRAPNTRMSCLDLWMPGVDQHPPGVEFDSTSDLRGNICITSVRCRCFPLLLFFFGGGGSHPCQSTRFAKSRGRHDSWGKICANLQSKHVCHRADLQSRFEPATLALTKPNARACPNLRLSGECGNEPRLWSP